MINVPQLPIEYTLHNGQKIHDAITFFKQKIVDHLGNMVKFEVLSHIDTLHFDELMENIREEDKYTIDMLILKEILAYIKSHGITHVLSYNINPSTLINPKFIPEILEISSHYNHDVLTKIEFEITENGYFTPAEILILNNNIKKIESLGIKIGIDDYPNLNNNNELLDKLESIDFVKIDKAPLMHFKDGTISELQLLEKISRYINDIRQRVGSDILIVIEGVETKALFDILQKNFGTQVYLFQGYYFHQNDLL